MTDEPRRRRDALPRSVAQRVGTVGTDLDALPLRRFAFSSLSAAAFALAFCGFASFAHADDDDQPGMPGAPTGGPGGPTQAGKDKKEGPAEEAPKDKEALQPIEAVPAQPGTQRRVQFFEAHGYMRMRSDFFHRMDFGLQPVVAGEQVGVGKYFPPPAQTPNVDDDGVQTTNNGGCAAVAQLKGASINQISRRCPRRNGIASANLRLRVTPIFHITDTVEVRTTFDVLDNLVLGSTPDSYSREVPWAPIDYYTRSQQPAQAGINSVTDSVAVKEAYGHIHFGWGLDIKFGRMFNHWGLGIVYNDGNGYDRLQKDDLIRHLDQDWGDSVDSVAFAFDLGKDPRTAHRLSISYDWAASGPTAAELLGQKYASGSALGQDFSVERYDNVIQFSAAVERRDDPDLLRRKLSLGNPVVNYGLKSWFRFQDIDAAAVAPPTLDDPDDEGFRDGLQPYANSLVARRAFMATPDVWMRVNWRTLRFEIEGAMNIGYLYLQDLQAAADDSNFEYTEVQARDRAIVLNGGYALEFKYGLFDDRFHIGFDQGFATGDSSPSTSGDPTDPINAELVNGGLLGVDPRLSTFRMNPAYTQDLLLFRETLGTVANAAYFRPWAAFYFFQNYFSARADFQYAFAQSPGATPGDNRNYGLELDGAIRFHGKREPIFVQLQYGVLFPFGAFNEPNARPPNADPPGGLTDPSGDARAQQTVQAQIGIKF